MDWLSGMNKIIAIIEENLTGDIDYRRLSRVVGCSVFEFSKIFSFMAGVPVSEYVRRRRLSQAAFDLQSGGKKVIDIALKYGYESPTAFARAFRELHGIPPSSAKLPGAVLKTYPPISFLLTIRGVSAMEFRMQQTEEFEIVGMVDKGSSENQDYLDSEPVVGPIWQRFMDEYDPRLYNGGGDGNLYHAPLWQVAAYSFQLDGETAIGAEYTGLCPAGMELYTVPAAQWAVFSFPGPTGYPNVPEAYTRILTEWFPQSGYRRDPDVPNLEVYPAGDIHAPEYRWEIWMPVKKA